MTDYTITIEHSTFDHGASVIYNDYNEKASGQSKPYDELCKEINGIKSSIEKTEPLIAKALQELQSAIERNDQPRISLLIKDLSKGTAASLLANIASSALLGFLGI